MFSEERKDLATRGALVATAVGLLAVAFILAVGVLSPVAGSGIERDKYQLVVLKNGHRYFGQLRDIGNAYVTLNNVYYVKSAQGQPGQPAPDQNLTLVTLGDELPQPEQRLSIQADQIVYYQNLRDDSKVVKAINDAKNKPK